MNYVREKITAKEILNHVMTTLENPNVSEVLIDIFDDIVRDFLIEMLRDHKLNFEITKGNAILIRKF